MNQCESIKSYLCNATKYQAFEVVDISDILLSCGPQYTRCVSRQIAFLLTLHNQIVHFRSWKECLSLVWLVRHVGMHLVMFNTTRSYGRVMHPETAIKGIAIK